jgi:hypothetical protein
MLLNKHEATELAKNCQKVVSDALLLGKVSKLDDLLIGDKLKEMMQEASITNPILVIKNPVTFNSFSTKEIMNQTRAHEIAHLTPVVKNSQISNVKQSNITKSMVERFIHWIDMSLFGIKKSHHLKTENASDKNIFSKRQQTL